MYQYCRAFYKSCSWAQQLLQKLYHIWSLHLPEIQGPVQLTLLYRKVLKCWPAGSEQASHPLSFFPAHDGALCLEVLAISLGIIVTLIQIWMSRREQSVYCQTFAEYVLYGSHWETCCVSYSTVLHEVIPHFLHILLFLWGILPELTKHSSRNLLFLWKFRPFWFFMHALHTRQH